MKEREALKLALDALVYLKKPIANGWNAEAQKEAQDKAITAIKEALAQPEKNTVEAIKTVLKGIDQTEIESPYGWWETSSGAEFGAKKLKYVIGLLAQPELCKYGQEPKSCTSSPMDCQCALDATFAQPEQCRKEQRGNGEYVCNCKSGECPELAQPEQEPVAWITQGGKGWLRWHKSYDDNKDSVPLYTTPPQRKPLTDEQIAHATAPVFMGGNPSLTGIARVIEAAHGIKE